MTLVLSLAPAASAVPQAKAWERWGRHDPSSQQSIDHSDWDLLLERLVEVSADGPNRVDYGGVTPADRARLGRYLDRLSAVAISTHARPEQKAFWINLYNALTVQVVLDHYPVKSIRDIAISPGWFSVGPWGRALVQIEGTALSLDDVEHRILRPLWRDPRIHYALNCASLGCPDLQDRAFTAAGTDALLDASARSYINHPRGVERAPEGWILSRIYDWFAEDFGGDEDRVIEHLKHYATPELAAALSAAPRIAGYTYDWNLNDSASKGW